MSKFDKIKETLSETALLNRYLKSRGINPEFVTKDQKVAHSKTTQFKVWMNSHVNEAVDKKDTITFDIPLLIRVLEFAREDLKSDINLHKMVERLLAIRGKGTLTMNQYGTIVKESFEDLNEEQLDEISKELANSYMWQAKSDRDKIDNRRMKLHDKNSQQMRYQGSISLRRHKNITKLLAKSGKRTDGINRALDRLAKEETELDESWKYHTYPSNEVARAAVKAHHSYRDENGMASGNPARAMGNGKVAYKGEFKGPKPTKSVSEAKEANYGGDYQASVLRVKELAKKKPVDMKSLAARMQASYAKDEKKPVKEDISRRGVLKGILGATAAGAAGKASAIAGAFPSPSTRAKWAKDAEESNRNEAKRQAEKKKKELEDNTKEVERQQKINHHSLANESALPRNLVWDGERVKKDPAVVAGNKRKKNYQAYLRRKAAKEKTPVEESLEPMAACNQPGDGANTPDDVVPSKAKKVKLLLGDKKKPVTEEMYDHEKEDKSVATPGKKVKVDKPQQNSITKEQPPAAAILSGGKTMTGETRDTIEIDPMMKLKKPSPDSQKSV